MPAKRAVPCRIEAWVTGAAPMRAEPPFGGKPRRMFPECEFGIKEEKIAARVPGIDVILTGHTHDALPRPVQDLREPFTKDVARVVGRTESLLWRRNNTAGTWDDVICDALLEQRDTAIALSPGFRWGTSLRPATDITAEDVWAQTAITDPAGYRSVMRGAVIKALLEGIADNLFNPDPFDQQGGDLVRRGGRPTDLAFGVSPLGQGAAEGHATQ